MNAKSIMVQGPRDFRNSESVVKIHLKLLVLGTSELDENLYFFRSGT